MIYLTLMKNHKILYAMSCQAMLPLVFRLNTYPISFSKCQQHFLHLSSPSCLYASVVLKKKEVTEYGNPNAEKVKKKSFSGSPMIKLLDLNNKVSYLPLEKATKIANHKNYKLVKLEEGTEHLNPLYKLVRNIFSEEKTLNKKPLKPGIKGEKRLIISDNIAEADLKVKLKKIAGFVDKCYDVNIYIQSSSSSSSSSGASKLTECFDAIQKNIEEKGEIVQKQQMAQGLKFLITPVQSKEESS